MATWSNPWSWPIRHEDIWAALRILFNDLGPDVVVDMLRRNGVAETDIPAIVRDLEADAEGDR